MILGKKHNKDQSSNDSTLDAEIQLRRMSSSPESKYIEPEIWIGDEALEAQYRLRYAEYVGHDKF